MRSLLPCRDAAGLLVAMARSSHQDAEDQAPEQMHTDQNQAASAELAAQDQQHLQAQDLAAGYQSPHRRPSNKLLLSRAILLTPASCATDLSRGIQVSKLRHCLTRSPLLLPHLYLPYSMPLLGNLWPTPCSNTPKAKILTSSAKPGEHKHNACAELHNQQNSGLL